jgi:hypothetical protein
VLTRKRVPGPAVAALALLLACTAPARAGLIIALHQGAHDPTTEGFVNFANIGTATTGPVLNDMGHDAWSIAASGNQVGDLIQFSPGQQQAVSQGFTMSLLARVVQGPVDPTGTFFFYPSIGAAIDVGSTRRFDLYLGIDSNGDTVATLADTLVPSGFGFFTHGATYTLTDSGYHQYQLVYNPGTQTADLFIDGIDRIMGYQGQTGYVSGGVAAFGAFNTGQGNFSSFQVEVNGGASAAPAPHGLALLASAAVSLVGYGWRRRAVPAARPSCVPGPWAGPAEDRMWPIVSR